jgi:hypothetical protein
MSLSSAEPLTPPPCRPTAGRVARLAWRRARAWRVFDRPIFVLAGPRSGSTLLYEMLSAFEQTRGHHAEMPYRPYAPQRYLAEAEATPRLARDVRDFVYHRTIWSREQRGLAVPWAERLGLRRVRYIDKTIKHCFEVPAMRRVFPTARFVYLKRDPRAAIASMLDGYPRAIRQPVYPELATVRPDIADFMYPLPPGWAERMPAGRAAAHAWAWCEHAEAVMAARRGDDAARWHELRYEELVADPEGCLRRVAAFAELAWDGGVDRHLAALPLSRTTQLAPSADKWRERHGATIERLMPVIAPTMRRMGYAAATPGDATPLRTRAA